MKWRPNAGGCSRGSPAPGASRTTSSKDDLDKLRDFYREIGFLDINIPQDKVVFSYPTAEKLVITINITEGRQYRVGEISFSGNKLFTSALLKRVARIRTGMVFVPSKLDKDTERVEDFYGKDGYLQTNVRNPP